MSSAGKSMRHFTPELTAFLMAQKMTPHISIWVPHLRAGTGRVGSVFLSFFSWGVGRKPLVLGVLAQESKACIREQERTVRITMVMRLSVVSMPWLQDHPSVGGETRIMENQYNVFLRKVSHSIWRFSFPLCKLAWAHAKLLKVAEVGEAAWFSCTYVLKAKAFVRLKPWFK